MIPRNRESSKKAIWGPVVMISMEDGEDCKRTVMLRMVSPIALGAAVLLNAVPVNMMGMMARWAMLAMSVL